MPLPRHVANGAAGQRQADQGENKGNHVAEARIWNLHAPFGRETSTGAQRVRRNAASFQPFSGEEAARKLTPAVNRSIGPADSIQHRATFPIGSALF